MASIDYGEAVLHFVGDYTELSAGAQRAIEASLGGSAATRAAADAGKRVGRDFARTLAGETGKDGTAPKNIGGPASAYSSAGRERGRLFADAAARVTNDGTFREAASKMLRDPRVVSLADSAGTQVGKALTGQLRRSVGGTPLREQLRTWMQAPGNVQAASNAGATLGRAFGNSVNTRLARVHDVTTGLWRSVRGSAEPEKEGRYAAGRFASAAKKETEKAGKGGGIASLLFGGSLLGIGMSAVSSLTAGLSGYLSEAKEASDANIKFGQTMGFAKVAAPQIQAATRATQDYANRTVYDLADIQNTTAQLASNGVANYEQLAEAAGNLNAVAGGNKESFKSVAMMLTQTAGAGKLTTENWNQLADAIPGASGVLQEQMRKNGAYTGDFRTAMEKGQISAGEFNKALMQLGTSDAAVKAASSTKTIEGAWGNLQAAIVTGLGNIMTQLTPAMTSLMNWASAVLPSVFSGASKAVGWLTSAVSGLRGQLTGLPAVAQTAFGWASRNAGALMEVAGAVALIVAQVKLYQAVTAAGGVLSWIGQVTGLTRAWAGAQAALNFVMDANPIFLVVVAITALVAGLVIAYRHSETFRGGVNAVWGALKSAAGAVAGWASALAGGLGSAASAVGGWASGIYQTVSGWFGRIPGLVSGWAGALTGGLSAGTGAVGGWAAGVYQTVARWFGRVTGAITGAFSAAWAWVSGVFRGVWAGISAVFGPPLNTVSKIVSVFWAAIKLAFSAAARWVASTFKAGWQTAVAIIAGPVGVAAILVSQHWASIRRYFNAGLGWTAGAFRTGWAAVSGWLTVPVTIARDWIAQRWQSIRNGFAASKTWVGSTWRAGWSAVSSWISAPVAAARTWVGQQWSGIQSRFSQARAWVGSTWRAGWSAVSSWITTPVRAAYNAVAGPGGLLYRLRAGFVTAVTSIRRTWDGVKSAISSPIRWAADHSVNPMIRGFNSLADKVGMGDKKLTPWTGFERGGFTGWMGRKTVAGVVHGREFVMDAMTTAKAGGARAMEAIRAAVRAGWSPLDHLSAPVGGARSLPRRLAGAAGRVPGYFAGGYVWPTNGKTISPSYPGHSGVDIAVPTGSPLIAVEDGVIDYVGWGRGYGNAIFLRGNDGVNWVYGHGNHHPASTRAGEIVKKGQLIGYSASTGHSTGPHLHIEATRGAFAQSQNRAFTLALLKGGIIVKGIMGAANAAGNIFGKFANAAEWLGEKFKSPLSALSGAGSSVWADMVKSPVRWVADGLKSWGSKLFDVLGITDSDAKNSGPAPKGDAIQRWAPLVRQALAINGLPVTDAYVNAWLRQIKSESSGDPNQVQSSAVYDINIAHGDPARGLVQIPKVTWDDFGYGMGAFIPNVYNPLKNLIVGMRQAKKNYRHMLAVIGHGHGYASGVDYAPRGWHLVGENGPELRWFDGGERVLSNQQTRRALNPLTGGAGVTGGTMGGGDSYGDINITLSIDDLERMGEVTDWLRKMKGQRAASRGTARSGRVNA